MVEIDKSDAPPSGQSGYHRVANNPGQHFHLLDIMQKDNLICDNSTFFFFYVIHEAVVHSVPIITRLLLLPYLVPVPNI